MITKICEFCQTDCICKLISFNIYHREFWPSYCNDCWTKPADDLFEDMYQRFIAIPIFNQLTEAINFGKINGLQSFNYPVIKTLPRPRGGSEHVYGAEPMIVQDNQLISCTPLGALSFQESFLKLIRQTKHGRLTSYPNPTLLGTTQLAKLLKVPESWIRGFECGWNFVGLAPEWFRNLHDPWAFDLGISWKDKFVL